jgi:rhodanese-related sulfurtransferase
MNSRARKSIVVFLVLAIMSAASIATACGFFGNISVNGENLSVGQSFLINNPGVYKLVAAVAEKLGADTTKDKRGNVSIVSTSGDTFLSGKNDPNQASPSIHTNFVKSTDLLAILDDDGDGNLCDYRGGMDGGDDISDDPLVLDVRNYDDPSKGGYTQGHIPNAVWIAFAQDMAKLDNIKTLRQKLKEHVAGGGKNEIVVYCYTGNTAGLVCGVLGTYGFNIKTLRFGYKISWDGSGSADAPLPNPAPVEY